MEAFFEVVVVYEYFCIIICLIALFQYFTIIAMIKSFKQEEERKELKK